MFNLIVCSRTWKWWGVYYNFPRDTEVAISRASSLATLHPGSRADIGVTELDLTDVESSSGERWMSVETDVASFPPTPVAEQRQLVAYWLCWFLLQIITSKSSYSAESSSVFTDPSSFLSTVTPETSVSSVYVNSVVTDELVSSEPELPPDSASDLAPVHEKSEPCLAFC